MPIRNVKIITPKIMSQYTGDNSNALEHGCQLLVHILKHESYHQNIGSLFWM